jgi:hypothetical protein
MTLKGHEATISRQIPTRLQRADRIRRLYAGGHIDSVFGIKELRSIYPRLTLTPAGWYRLLTGR